jgi:hypothetical protein
MIFSRTLQSSRFRESFLWGLVALLPLALAWRLALGARLYADLGYLYGPVSPYLNAVGFRIAGATRGTLLCMNLAVYLLCMGFIRALLLRLVRPSSAALALLLVTLFFGFNQLVFNANYNFLTPYRHGVTHALALSLASLYFWHRGENLLSSAQKSSAYFFAASALAGLAALTKMEIFLALALALGYSAASLLVRDGKRARLACASALGGFLFALGSGLAFLVAALRIGGAEALKWILFPYRLATNARVRGLAIYAGSVENFSWSTLFDLGKILLLAALVF